MMQSMAAESIGQCHRIAHPAECKTMSGLPCAGAATAEGEPGRVQSTANKIKSNKSHSGAQAMS